MSTASQIEPRYLTLDEFMARPDREDDQREELLEGELIAFPGPKVRHADIVWRLRRSLALLEETGAFVIANDFSCVLRPRSMPIPDLGVVRREPWEQALRDAQSRDLSRSRSRASVDSVPEVAQRRSANR